MTTNETTPTEIEVLADRLARAWNARRRRHDEAEPEADEREVAA